MVDYDIVNIPETTVSILVNNISLTDWVQVDSTVSPDRLRATVDYTFVDGDVNYPLTCRVQINSDPKANNGVGKVNYSVRLRATQTAHDEVTSALIWDGPASVVVAFEVPGQTLHNAGEVMRMISTAYFLLCQNPSAGSVAQTAQLTKLAYGTPQILG